MKRKKKISFKKILSIKKEPPQKKEPKRKTEIEKIETKATKPITAKVKETSTQPEIIKTTSKREEIMIIKAGNELYGIPLACVEEIRNEIKLTRTPQLSELLSGIAEIRDLIIPVVNLEKLFGIETENKRIKKIPVIVVEISGQLVGIQVSKIIEIVEIQKNEILPLPDIFPPKLFSGGYSYKSIVVGIINIESLLKGKQIQSFKEKINEVVK